MSANRASFEKWAEESGWDLYRTEEGSYRTESTDAAWGGWSACADAVTAERDALKTEIPKWWNCDTHGGQQHAWGCPECVRELRTQNAALRAALIDAGRLDWLEANRRLSEIIINGKSQDCYFYGVVGAAGLSLREVIDAVRARGAQETGE